MIDAGEKGLIALAHISPLDLERNRLVVQRTNNRVGGAPSVVTWFLPSVDHALKGGVRTVFMFAEAMSRRHGTVNQFVIVGYGSVHPETESLAKSLAQHFPALEFTIFPFRTRIDDPDSIPAADCAVCTLWTTAYVCARYNSTRAKFYLVQDFEPLFYPAGSVSSVIEHTYRLGFAMLANTRGVAVHLGKFTRDVTQFTPGVDCSLFHPRVGKERPGKPSRLVFYGRPANARNCFSLGIDILQRVKATLGSDVDIVSVGAAWDEAEAGVDGVVRNLGLLGSMEEVAELYRSSDVGLVFMATPHPSYQPLEYMASGCVTATNRNDSTNWLLNASNSLVLDPIPAIAAAQICDLIRDEDRWIRLRDAGLQQSRALSWRESIEKVLGRMST